MTNETSRPATYEGKIARWWVHGAPAYGLYQVLDYMAGDAHDRSKVQIFENGRFRQATDEDVEMAVDAAHE